MCSHNHLALLMLCFMMCKAQGGSRLGSLVTSFLTNHYGVTSMEHSAQRIVETVHAADPANNSLVLIAHNGPAGLGEKRYDICGVDFRSDEGDHGDPDLQSALCQLADEGVHVSMVVFGHMHHNLRGRRGWISDKWVHDVNNIRLHTTVFMNTLLTAVCGSRVSW